MTYSISLIPRQSYPAARRRSWSQVFKIRSMPRLNLYQPNRTPDASRTVTYHYDDDGCVVIKARMPAEQGELVIRALERAMDAQDVYPEGTSSAETPAEIPEEREPGAARRADALSEMAESYLRLLRDDHR